MEEISRNIGRRTLKNFGPSSRRGEKSYTDEYADADTIPGMASSTEREGGSSAKKKGRITTKK